MIENNKYFFRFVWYKKNFRIKNIWTEIVSQITHKNCFSNVFCLSFHSYFYWIQCLLVFRKTSIEFKWLSERLIQCIDSYKERFPYLSLLSFSWCLTLMRTSPRNVFHKIYWKSHSFVIISAGSLLIGHVVNENDIKTEFNAWFAGMSRYWTQHFTIKGMAIHPM